jgi:Family of unknown function (DUF5990)
MVICRSELKAPTSPETPAIPALTLPADITTSIVEVQRRNQPDELLGLVPGDASSATWTVDWQAVTSATGVDLKGPYIQGSPGGGSSISHGSPSVTITVSRCSGGRNCGQRAQVAGGAVKGSVRRHFTRQAEALR